MTDRSADPTTPRRQTSGSVVEASQDLGASGVQTLRHVLLPTVGDLEPECDCPDWGWPCKHAAALCYQIARLLDVDPFVLLLMRGRGERELMEELRRRNAVLAAATADGGSGSGVDALGIGASAGARSGTGAPGTAGTIEVPQAPGQDL